jgi:Uma2 family endonuclease
VPDTITETTYRWSRDAYDRAVDAGVFGPDDRLELIDGQLLAMNPQGSRHAAIVGLAGEILRGAFGDGCTVRMQCPLAVADDSEPEPDLAVVAGREVDYLDAHPTTALLVVEVSDDSLLRDRTVKQRLYARHGIPEYWILALPAARLEVYRDPAETEYRTVLMRRPGETIAPRARPSATIAVGDLLPWPT